MGCRHVGHVESLSSSSRRVRSSNISFFSEEHQDLQAEDRQRALLCKTVENEQAFRHCGINVGGLSGMGGRFQWKWCAGHAGSSEVALAEVGRSALSLETRAP